MLLTFIKNKFRILLLSCFTLVWIDDQISESETEEGSDRILCSERAMNTVLAGLTWECCFVFVDDVIIHSPRAEPVRVTRLADKWGSKQSKKNVEYSTDSGLSHGHRVNGMNHVPNNEPSPTLPSFQDPYSVLSFLSLPYRPLSRSNQQLPPFLLYRFPVLSH